MATIKDIAKLAGVSHGTVSNVLNNRGNVSVEKIEAVHRAAKQMGYQLNARAQLLRAGNSERVAVILPGIGTERYYQLFNGLSQTLDSLGGITPDLYLTEDLPAREQTIIQKIAAQGYSNVVTVSCLPDASAYFDVLKIDPACICFVYRQPAGSVSFFSLDFVQAAREISQQATSVQAKTVGIFCEPLHFSHAQQFVTTLQQTLGCQQPAPQMMLRETPDNQCYPVAFDFFADGKVPDLLITQDRERAGYLMQASNLGSVQACPPIYSLSDKNTISYSGITRYRMNYAQLGSVVAESLMGNETAGNDQTSPGGGYCLENSGFSLFPQATPHSGKAGRLNLLTLPSPSTDALQKLLPHFYRLHGIEVNLAIRPFDELFDILSELHLHPYYDVLRIDMACLPWFAERLLQPLDNIGQGVEDLLSGFAPSLVDKFSAVNGVYYGLPFDASTQLLFYRSDLFGDSVIKRMFYETYGRELQVPQDFAEFDTVSAFFSAHRKQDNPQRPMGSAITVGSAGLIATEYLMRYYAAGGRLLRPGLPPQLEEQIGAQVLSEYLQQKAFAEVLPGKWWSASVEEFSRGNLAMLIVYMNLLNDMAPLPLSPSIGYAAIPGKTPQLGGGTLGVSRYSNRLSEVELFFRWLYSPSIMEQLTLLGGCGIHPLAIQNQEICQRYPWLALTHKELDNGIRESSSPDGTMFNLRQAEIIVGQGITNALNNMMSQQEAIAYINLRLLNEARGDRF
ncbi:MAG: extracellular solute-binding protein [Enterobacteriaceae bacterium]